MFPINTFLRFLLHILIYTMLIGVLIIGFFNFYLPASTRHGETITVPDLTNMNLTEMEEFLGSRNLKYEINDSSFHLDKAPLTIISQYPKAGAKVKEKRKIYLSINSIEPPEVRMPNIVDNSLKSADMMLRSYGLQLGRVRYVPDLAQNAILKQLLDGKEIKPGTYLKKGSKIDLVVGDGLGEQEFTIPNLIGLALDEAELVLSANNLRVGSIVYQPSIKEKDGLIVRQIPDSESGKKIRQGQLIDLFVGGANPLDSLKYEEPVE